MTDPIIVVGASQAGLQVAESLRQEGYDGPLVMIGDEPHPPYQRPPLSKALLTGETTEDRLVLRGRDLLAKRFISAAQHDTDIARLSTDGVSALTVGRDINGRSRSPTV